MQVRCASCGCTFEADDRYQGNAMRCPLCGKAVMVQNMAAQMPPQGGMMPPQGVGTPAKSGGKVLLIVALVLGVIVLGGGLVSLGVYFAWRNSFSGGPNKSAQTREIEYQKVMTRRLGNYLKERYAGKTAIIIKDPYSKDDAPFMVGLKEGLGGALTIVDTIYPEPPTKSDNPAMEMMDPMETWYTKSVLERMLKGKEADLVITSIGLPIGVVCIGKDFNASCLRGKKVVFAGGSIYDQKRAFANGCLVAAVTYKPNAEYDERPVPKDLQAAFDKRFLLVTSENYKDVMNAHPDIFQQ